MGTILTRKLGCMQTFNQVQILVVQTLVSVSPSVLPYNKTNNIVFAKYVGNQQVSKVNSTCIAVVLLSDFTVEV